MSSSQNGHPFMSDLTFVEKHKFEQFLGMDSGYVLDFNNRTFSGIVFDTTGRDIFNADYDFGSGSKANRLRAFWLKEDNQTVGKLMKAILDYCDETGPGQEVCHLIVGRLLGANAVQQTPAEDGKNRSSNINGAPVGTPRTEPSQQLDSQLAQLKDEFLLLAKEEDRNKAGLSLEKLLNRVFELFQLRPRQPFRVVGEQIDGSFELESHIYLVESKWEKHPLPVAELYVFRTKIENKSPFTRGVFIALNDISAQAREAITRGRPSPFFVMNGYDLMMILSGKMDLPDFLRRRVRLLAEEGRVCVPFPELS
jgi:hypothetical protein